MFIRYQHKNHTQITGTYIGLWNGNNPIYLKVGPQYFEENVIKLYKKFISCEFTSPNRIYTCKPSDWYIYINSNGNIEAAVTGNIRFNREMPCGEQLNENFLNKTITGSGRICQALPSHFGG